MTTPTGSQITRAGSGGTPELITSFTYDPLGRRISKTTPGPGVPSAPVTTQFIYGGDDDCDVKDEIIETRQFATLIDSFIHKHDDGLLIAKISAAGEVAHYHCDDLG